MNISTRGGRMFWCAYWLALAMYHAFMCGYYLAITPPASAAHLIGVLVAVFMFGLGWREKVEPKQIQPEPETLSSRFASGYKPSFREEGN